MWSVIPGRPAPGLGFARSPSAYRSWTSRIWQRFRINLIAGLGVVASRERAELLGGTIEFARPAERRDTVKLRAHLLILLKPEA